MYLLRLRVRRLVSASRGALWVAVLSCVQVAAPHTAVAQGAGYWHTSAERILDRTNAEVRIAGINWYGFETQNAVLAGLNAQDYKTLLQTLKTQGFNTVRIPLSSQMIEAPSYNLPIAYTNSSGPINADLHGLNSLQVLDHIVAYAGSIGLKVILDHHRSEAGSSAEENGLWYTARYPESSWIADWTMLADRYAGDPAVIGFDLHNEPHTVPTGGACWDCGGSGDWHLAAERAGDAILAINPRLLIFVEGTDAYHGDSYWWGGNLEGVASSPVRLSVPDHLVYSPHEYGPSETPQPWFNAATTYTSLTSTWDRHWSYISEQHIAPVWLGEFGTTNNADDIQSNAAGSQGQWFQSLIAFLNAHPSTSWNYWAVNGEDAYSLLTTTYDATPLSPAKSTMLASISFPLAAPKYQARSTVPVQTDPSATDPGSRTGLIWTLIGGSGVTFALFLSKQSNTDDPEPLEETAPDLTIPAIRRAGAPATPARLEALPVSSTDIELSWRASTTKGATYDVYCGSCANNIRDMLISGVSATSHIVSGLQAATAHYFVVEAMAGSIRSNPSEVASATTPVAAVHTAPESYPPGLGC